MSRQMMKISIKRLIDSHASYIFVRNLFNTFNGFGQSSRRERVKSDRDMESQFFSNSTQNKKSWGSSEILTIAGTHHQHDCVRFSCTARPPTFFAADLCALQRRDRFS